MKSFIIILKGQGIVLRQKGCDGFTGEEGDICLSHATPLSGSYCLVKPNTVTRGPNLVIQVHAHH